MKRGAFLASALLLAGCEVGPDYHQPETKTPAQFQELPSRKADAPLSVPQASEADLSQWWMQIDDPELQKLIGAALKSNLDLQAAASRVREARQQEVIAGASALPKVSANGTALQLHANSSPLAALGGGSAQSGGSSGGGGAGGSPQSSSLNSHFYSLGFDATWELDIFGGVRRLVEAAQANTEAAVWQMRDGEVSLTAEIGNDYMALRAAQARAAVLRAEYQSAGDVLKLTAARAHAGFVTQLDVNQQKSETDTTAAQIPSLEADIRAQEHAIAVLLGQQPEAMTTELDQTAPLPAIPQTLPVGLPSDLLRRRPDMREAERKLAAANAQIGVAVADLYPKFNLMGLLSMGGPQIGDVLSTNHLTEAGVGQITWSIFNGGQVRANIRAKKEEERQALYAYQSAVLKAIQDAEDALVRYTKEQQRFLALQSATRTAQSSVTLAERQYRVGLVTYVNVLTAEQQYRQSQDQLLQSRQALSQDLISLYKALGGGWSTSDQPAISPKGA
ncbi:MAG TPA: efflux transporter outer membrane subunit [Rhizomicrobium sp.]|jgi:NodT family efflux transporter outer membrane factor (OMF) lipoprotein